MSADHRPQMITPQSAHRYTPAVFNHWSCAAEDVSMATYMLFYWDGLHPGRRMSVIMDEISVLMTRPITHTPCPLQMPMPSFSFNRLVSFSLRPLCLTGFFC